MSASVTCCSPRTRPPRSRRARPPARSSTSPRCGSTTSRCPPGRGSPPRSTSGRACPDRRCGTRQAARPHPRRCRRIADGATGSCPPPGDARRADGPERRAVDLDRRRVPRHREADHDPARPGRGPRPAAPRGRPGPPPPPAACDPPSASPPVPARSRSGAFPQSRVATSLTVSVPTPSAPLPVTSSVNSVPPAVTPHGSPRMVWSTW